METALKDTIERELLLKAPIKRVYAAIAEPEQIVKWFPDGIEGKLQKGERPVLDFGEYGKHAILVTAAEPHHYFAYRWTPGSVPGSLGRVEDRPNTLVEFRLEKIEGGTRLRLKESGFASLPSEYYEGAVKDNTEGWAFMLDRLEKYVGKA